MSAQQQSPLATRLFNALDRIDAALRAKAEAGAANGDLQRRHDAMRQKTAAALHALDALIAREEGH